MDTRTSLISTRCAQSWASSRVGIIAISLAAFLLIFAYADPAFAQDDLEGVTQLEEIMERIKSWIQALAITFCIVMVCVAGARYLASSNPTGSERAKSALMAAAIGLAIVLLAEPLVDILTWFINGSGE